LISGRNDGKDVVRMGMILNHVTLVYDYDERLQELRNKAIEMFDPLMHERVQTMKTDGEFVSPIISSLSNGEEFFIINTDGSKVGWETNSAFQKVRKEFVQYCRDYGAMQVATIEFGENDKPILTDLVY